MLSTLRANMLARVLRLATHQLQWQHRTLKETTALRALFVSPNKIPVRSMGVFSNLKKTVSGKLEERNQHKQDEMYKQQMLDLSQIDKFDLNGFYDHLKKNADASGVNGWRAMIPGVSSMTAVQQMKMFLTILESIEPEYRANPRLINGKVKRNIAEKSGSSPEEINNMLRNYEQLSALHIWLTKRVERGLSIPESVQETTELVRMDPTGFPAKKFRKKQRRY